MDMFKKLELKEEIEFKMFVDEDEFVKLFLKKASCWHPVIRDELIKRLKVMPK